MSTSTLPTRPYNFAAGPAAVPEAVLRVAQTELLDWRGTGMSVMEMSHRGKEFTQIQAHALGKMRSLLNVPANYKILFLQGGAIAQNALIPLNMLRGKSGADYINTGAWSEKAIAEARRYCTVNVAADNTASSYTRIPDEGTWRLKADAAYVHICHNETIHGVEYFFTPDTAGVPLIADMVSNILSRPVDVSRYALIYAGAQKNFGIAGLTLVIVREDLLGEAHPLTPTAFNYMVVADNGSMYNTPPTYAIYMAGLVFDWIEAQGGVAALEQVNLRKSQLLYEAIDASHLYVNRVDPSCRSRMNIPFFLRDEALNEAFLTGAQARGLLQLKGHKSVGGMRASIYNAMPLEGVQALVDYMQEFEKQH